MRRTSRLCTVLDQSHQTMAPTMPTTTTCQMMPRNRSSDQESRIGRFGGARRLRGSMVVCDMAGIPPTGKPARAGGPGRSISTEGRRVLQAALGILRIRAAGALDADGHQVALEDLAVIAHGLDDVHRPGIVQPQRLAQV